MMKRAEQGFILAFCKVGMRAMLHRRSRFGCAQLSRRSAGTTPGVLMPRRSMRSALSLPVAPSCRMERCELHLTLMQLPCPLSVEYCIMVVL